MPTYTGLFEQDTDGFFMPVADPSAELDMLWELDSDGYLMPRAAALSPVFPATGNTVTRQGVYGWAGEYTPTFTYPAVGNVLVGVLFGENGTEFTGEAVGGVTPAPTTPLIYVKNDLNGTTATATITGSDAGTTNQVYVVRMGRWHLPVLMGTRTGDGTLTITPGQQAEYEPFVISKQGTSYPAVALGAPFWVSPQNVIRTTLRTAGALAHLQVCKQVGLQGDFYNNDAVSTKVTVWYLDKTSTDSVTIHDRRRTGVRRALIEVPQQSGWPPTKVNPGSYFVLPSGDTSQDAVFGIEDIATVNNSIGINPVIAMNLERMDYDPRLGG